MGRPKIREKRERQLNIALTQAELVAAKRRADEHGMRLVDFARAAVCSGAVNVETTIAAVTFDRLTLQQWKRAGNNLNQVARQLNALGRVAPADLDGVLGDIRRLIQQADGHDP